MIAIGFIKNTDSLLARWMVDILVKFEEANVLNKVDLSLVLDQKDLVKRLEKSKSIEKIKNISPR